jgi:hypothetical protein
MVAILGKSFVVEYGKPVDLVAMRTIGARANLGSRTPVVPLSVIIASAKNATHQTSRWNLAPRSEEVMQRIREAYERHISPQIYQRW